jgi:hypothetical protein
MLVSRSGFSWRAVSLGEAAVVVLFCFGCRLPVSFLPLCVRVYMERCAVGPRPQGLLERPGEDLCLGSRRRVAVGGVGDGETGSVSLYIVGNLNKSDVLLYSIRFCLWQIERLLLQSDLRFLACLATTSTPLTSTLGYPYLRRYNRPL